MQPGTPITIIPCTYDSGIEKPFTITAYSENKGEKIAFCLNKTKDGDNLIDIKLLPSYIGIIFGNF